MNSIWLQEEEDGDREESWMENRSKGLNPSNGDPKGSTKKTIDPILGFSLEGKESAIDKQKEKLWPYQTYALMDHDLEDEVIIGGREKAK
ncbi:hypothetical protein Godav_029856 [Gossypium davidsonii]|uniref:Uncharacterized protein n=1 Tax=Gossypium davidsonii TaxID=34287 RepID=A0A7J8TEC2_GOSDV|nr:hypothetical protein [Gossypium davidsonii]